MSQHTTDVSDYTNGTPPEQRGSVIIDTPEGIAFAQLLSFRGRLKLEVHNGMTSRINTLQAYNNVYGTNFKTRKKALRDCNRRIEEAEQEAAKNVAGAKTHERADAEYRAKLENMSVAQLREVCRQAEIKGYSKLKKADLVDMLMENVHREIEERLG